MRVAFLSLFLLVATLSQAEDRPTILISQQAQLQAELIIDSEIGTESVQLVMNPVALSENGLSESLPQFCLLNVQGRIEAGEVKLQPGKLVCVADDKRILETVIKGELTGAPGCNACRSLAIKSGTSFGLILSEDVELTLQKRADEVE